MKLWKSARDLADARQVVERRAPHGPITLWGDESSTYAELPSGVTIAVELNAAFGADDAHRRQLATGIGVRIDGEPAARLERAGDGLGRIERSVSVTAFDDRLADGARFIAVGWSRAYSDGSLILERDGGVVVGPHRGWVLGALRRLRVAEGTSPETTAMYLAVRRGVGVLIA